MRRHTPDAIEDTREWACNFLYLMGCIRGFYPSISRTGTRRSIRYGDGDEGYGDLAISGQDDGRGEAATGTSGVTRHQRRPGRAYRGRQGSGDHLALTSAVSWP